MRKQGTIVRWDEGRGFGFIRSPSTSAQVFFHVRDFRGGDQRPREGQQVEFEELHVGGKGPRAVAVQPAGASAPLPSAHERGASMRSGPVRPRSTGGGERRQDRHADLAMAHRPEARRPAAHGARRDRHSHRPAASDRSGYLVLPLMLAYAAMLVWAVSARLLPWWVLPASAVLNLATFFAYWQDKYAAGTGQWRTREQTLHLWGVAGGWGGAWFAQQVLRHKSRKQEFLAVWWATLVLHCCVVGAWLWVAAKL